MSRCYDAGMQFLFSFAAEDDAGNQYEINAVRDRLIQSTLDNQSGTGEVSYCLADGSPVIRKCEGLYMARGRGDINLTSDDPNAP